MSWLFDIYSKEVRPKPECLLIEPFKSIWNRDKSKDKEDAIADLSYCEFMASSSKSNPYSGYPEDTRKHKIINELYKGDRKPDRLCDEGVKKLEEFQTEGSVSYSYYMSAKKAVETMKEFYEHVDLNEKNAKTGSPLYKPADLTRALNDTEKVIQNLNNLKKKVDEELFESTRTKGGKAISPFASPSSLKK